MRKLTPAELAEPDVELTIPYTLALPKEIWLMLEGYIGYLTPTGTRFTIPAYLARDLNAMAEEYMRKLQSGD